MQIRAYLMAIEGIAIDAIARAARAFIRGEVPGRNSAFAPSCAEFAERSRHEALCMEAERKAGMRPKIEAPLDDTPRVAPEKVRLLARHLQGDQSATAELKRLYPANEIIAMADTPVSELEGENR
jgi:hypothetical protein